MSKYTLDNYSSRMQQLREERETKEALNKYRQVLETKQAEERDYNFLEKGLLNNVRPLYNVGKGAVKGVEGFVDALGIINSFTGIDAQIMKVISGVQGVVNQINGNDDEPTVYDKYKEWMKDTVQIDLTSKIFTPEADKVMLESNDLNKIKIGNKSLAEYESEIEQGVGGMLPSVVANIVVPGSGLAELGIQAGGNSAEEAYSEGASYGQGIAYGTMQGATEVATEKMFGTIGEHVYGKGILDNIFGNKATTGASRVVRGVLEEGGEELVSGVLQPVEKAIAFQKAEPLKEYGKSDFWLKDLPEQFAMGGLTAMAFEGTVGRAMGEGGINSDISSVMEANENIDKKLEKHHLTAEQRSNLEAQKASNLDKLSNQFKKLSEEKRSAAIEEHGLSEIYDNDGSIKKDFLESRMSSRYATVNTDKRTVQQDLEKISAESGEDIKLIEGDLSEQGDKNFNKLRATVNAANRLSDANISLAVVEANDSFNGAIIKDNRIYIGSDVVESGKAFETIIHELGHFAHGTQEQTLLYDLLKTDTELFDKVKTEIFSKEYGISEKDIRRIENKLRFGEKLAGYEQDIYNSYKDELTQTMSEYYLGNEQFIDRIVRSDRGLTGKIINRIETIIQILKANKVERDELRKYLYAEKLYMDALESAGLQYKKGQIIEAYKKALEDEENPGRNVRMLPEDRTGEKENSANSGEDIKYSIKHNVIDTNGNFYKNAVLLDTDIFEGHSPRKWGGILKEYIEDRVQKSTFIMPIQDENGNTQQLEFARINDKIKTKGGHPRKVLSELYETSDNLSKLSVVHIDEIIDVSEENTPYYTPKEKTEFDNKGWLNDKGWLHRFAYIINKNNNAIYKINIDIAKASDGRIILYSLNGKIKKIGNVDVGSSDYSQGPRHTSNLKNDDTTASLKSQEVSNKNYIQDTKNNTSVDKNSSDTKFSRKNSSSNSYEERRSAAEQQAMDIYSSITIGMSDDVYVAAIKNGYTLAQVIHNLTEGLETAKEDVQIKKAKRVATMLVDHIVLENIYKDADISDSIEKLNALKTYFHKIDLSGIKNEMKAHFGNDSTANRIFGKSGSGLTADMVAQELNSLGIKINATTEADSFFEIYDTYVKTRDFVKEQSGRLLKDGASAEERSAMISKLTNEIVGIIRTDGNTSVIAGIIEKQRKYIKKIKADAEKAVAKYKAQEAERRAKTELKEKIRKVKNEFEKRASHPVEGKYIPATLRGPIIEIMDMINDETKAGERIDTKFAEFKMRYDKENIVYDEEISKLIDSLHSFIANTSLQNMTLQQLDATYKTLKAIDKTMRDAIKMIGMEEGKTVFEVGENSMREVRGNKKDIGIFVGSQLTGLNLFEALGGFQKNSSMSMLGNSLDKGQLEYLRIYSEFSQSFDDLFLDTKTLRSLWKEKVDIGLTDKEGKPVYITRDMMLSVYMHLLNKDNARHVSRGGFTIPDIAEYNKGNRDTAFGKKSISSRGYSSELASIAEELAQINKQLEADPDNKALKTKKNEVDSKYKRLEVTMTQYANSLKASIESKLTDYERKWISAAQYFFDTASAKEINKVSNTLYGFDKASIKKYFPIVTDPNFINSDFDAIAYDYSITNAGFLKERIKSSNPILLEGMTDVISRHMQAVSKYCGLAIPIRNVNKVFNTVIPGYRDSVKQSINQKYGSTILKYVENVMSDLQNARKSDPGAFFANLLEKARGNIAPATLLLNVRTAMAQASSYITAASELGYEPLAKAAFKIRQQGGDKFVFAKAEKELIRKYSPLLWYRSMGYSITEIGDLVNDKSLSHVAQKKLKGLFGWIQAIDIATVGRLWYATQYWVDEHFNNLQFGTDEYYKKVAEKFNEVVEKTQPNYTTMQRPEVLRSKNAIERTLTMFMTQRLQNFNLCYANIRRWQRYSSDYKNNLNSVTIEDVKQAKTKAVNSVTSVAISAASIVFIKYLADALLHNLSPYKDDEDEITAESLALTLSTNFAESMASNVIGGSELFTLINKLITGDKYYGVSLSGVDSISSLFESIINLRNKASAKNFNELAKSLSQLLGIPLANAEKIINAIWQYSDDIFNGSLSKGLSKTGFGSYILTDSQNFRKSIQKALDSDNVEYASSLLSIMSNISGIGQLNDNTSDSIVTLQKKGYSIIPPIVPKSITVDGKEIELNSSQKDIYAKEYSQIGTTLNKITSSTEYRTADAETKAKAINKVYQLYKDIAREKITGEGASKNTLFSKAIPTDKLAVIVAQCQSVQSDTDKEGNVIAKSRLRKIELYLEKQKLSAAQKHMILGYLGYKNTYGRQKVRAYIESLRMTKADKEALFSYCGY